MSLNPTRKGVIALLVVGFKGSNNKVGGQESKRTRSGEKRKEL